KYSEILTGCFLHSSRGGFFFIYSNKVVDETAKQENTSTTSQINSIN
ncbi:unnamed protein product, partial [Tenebrio molitor]